MKVLYSAIPLLLLCYASSTAQTPHNVLRKDTTINAGSRISLYIDTLEAYDNFIFSAQDTATHKWTLWRKNIITFKYTPLFRDGYSRNCPVVSKDKAEIIYVRYRTVPKSDDTSTAWVCRSNIDGSNEKELFQIPGFNINAAYDLDWRPDKMKIIFAWGIDGKSAPVHYGDLMEYDITHNTLTDITNDPHHLNAYCKYSTNGAEIAYSHTHTAEDKKMTDIYIMAADGITTRITFPDRFNMGMEDYMLTDFFDNGQKILYRMDNFLFERTVGEKEETTLSDLRGMGGVYLDNRVYGATDLSNDILIITDSGLHVYCKVPVINNFYKEGSYTFRDMNVHLNWMGKLGPKVIWSTGDTTFAITVAPKQTTTYYYTITQDSISHTDSVTITVACKTPVPVITKDCLSLSTTGAYASYQWSLNGETVAGAVDSSYTPEKEGAYIVTVTDNSGCAATSKPLVLNTEETEHIKALKNGITITTDPATLIVHIHSQLKVNLALTNEAGKVLWKQDNADAIDLKGFPDGVYEVMVYDNNCIKLKTHRIVKG